MDDSDKIEQFSLSDETRKNRRSLLLISVLAFFIGLTGSLPTELSFVGLKFSDQAVAVSWFIFSITLFFFLAFLASSAVELSVFLKPRAFFAAYKKQLLQHPAYDETDWMDIAPPADPHNLDEVQGEARRDAKWAAEKAMKPLERFVWLRLLLDLVFPLIFSLVAMILLAVTITNRAEQDGADQPATAPESKLEGNSKREPDSEGRSQ